MECCGVRLIQGVHLIQVSIDSVIYMSNMYAIQMNSGNYVKNTPRDFHDICWH